MGIRCAAIAGPVAWTKGSVAAGPALTLQFMPKREDLYGDGEYKDVEKQLHRHVLYHVERGDMVVVDARADMRSGVFGEMMMTYFKGQGGAGMVIDGCLRDWPNIAKLGVPLWMRGVTPNFHTQTDLMPFAVNGPIACRRRHRDSRATSSSPTTTARWSFPPDSPRRASTRPERITSGRTSRAKCWRGAAICVATTRSPTPRAPSTRHGRRSGRGAIRHPDSGRPTRL